MPVLESRKEGTRGYGNSSKVRMKAARKIIKTCITVERKENLIATNTEARKTRTLVKELKGYKEKKYLTVKKISFRSNAKGIF